MAQSVQAAQAQANQNRVPLVIAVTESHQDAQNLARESGVLNGNSVVLSVPRTASQDLNFLNQASSSNLVPRVHVFPPTENGSRMQPQNIQQEIQQYTPFWVRLAGEVHGPSSSSRGANSVNEVTSVLQSFGAAASAWNNVQQQRRGTANQNGSPIRQDAAPLPAASKQPAQQASTANNNKPQQPLDNTDAADPSPHIRVIPKVHIRLHHTAPPSAELPHVPPQPRNTPLPALRKIVAKYAEKSFGDNFLFVEKNSNVMVRASNEGPLIAQDVSNGADLYVCPVAPVIVAAAPTPVKQDAAVASSSTTNNNTTAAASTASTRPAGGGGALRIKITYPDNTDEVVRSLKSSSLASELRDYIKSKYTQSENFIIQLPQSRIKDDEMDKTLEQLGMRGGVAVRVVDLDALKEERSKYEQQQNEEQQSMLSGLMSRLKGGPSASSSSADPSTEFGGDDVPPSSGTKPNNNSSRQPPRSMADIRRMQEEEAERKKKEAEKSGKGSNEFYGGAGTNTQAPPPDDDRPR